MFARQIKTFAKDDGGAVYVEVAASVFTFFILIFGIVEFSYIFYQYNSATKAVQWGARLAVVSDPVAENLKTLTGLENSALPGSTMPDFNCVCDGSTESCTGSVPTNAAACKYNAAAMSVIVFGRGNGSICSPASPNKGMCNFFSAVAPENVVVEYRYSGLGYAGRLAGPVPTVTVKLKGLSYDFILVGGLAGLSSVALPSFATTMTGEDLRVSGG